MEFHFAGPRTEFEKFIGGHHNINAVGPIRAGDGKRFKEFLIQTCPPPRSRLYIDSNGGDVDAAIEIGRLVREHWFETNVGTCVFTGNSQGSVIAPRDYRSGKCLSAATLVFLGGRIRNISAKSEFGVHQFAFKNPSPHAVAHSQILSARIAKYVNDMGVGSEFLETSAATDADQIHKLEIEDLEGMGVVTGGQTDCVWSIQGRNYSLYVRGERDSIYGHHKVMLGYNRSLGFYFHAVIEAQGREEELLSHGLVELVVDGERVRVDISKRCEREVHGIYVNIFVALTDEEAKLLAFSDSFGVQVRASCEASVFLGISAMSTEGGRSQLEALFYNMCSNETLLPNVLDANHSTP